MPMTSSAETEKQVKQKDWGTRNDLSKVVAEYGMTVCNGHEYIQELLEMRIISTRVEIKLREK
jgi:hypothetical protein